MPAIDIPLFGNVILCLTLIASAYTLAMAIGAGRGRPQLLVSARFGTYATCALVFVGVCVLAYAFQTHDFRIRYVARYSDRSMPWWYLVASLWGGQDGSLLWWTFLLAGYTALTTRWMTGRLLELQPWVLATLMSIFVFFVVLMLFAANPFAIQPGSAGADGEGLNPLLQNYWMVIHPPSLYLGFVGWSVPFAFVVAALISGRLHEEWVLACRRWALIAWTFLSLGLLLGCVWSYEELGWGGYWAWDPVENASFMPWLVGTAYLHSAMIQERYGMLKVWNVFLMCLTFFMTIFGTFLTRSGLIASVHSFAKSDIGTYFVYYLAFLIVGCFALIAWRLPKLKATHRIESLLSREFAFLMNNWVLLGMMLFVLVATTFPLTSEWLRGEEVTVGPDFYNKWMVPFGLVLLLLAGIGPLISWRKASGKNLLRAMMVPAVFGLAAMALHLLFGASVGLPPMVESEEIYDTMTGRVLAGLQSVLPIVSTTLCTFVAICVLQEFWRGARVRMSRGEHLGPALARLISRARRRYGGYIVHLGVVVMYFGFTGAAYDQETEAALMPGDEMRVSDYRLRYDRPRTTVDRNKKMLFTDLTLLSSSGQTLGRVAPAKFIYRTHPEMPTTEVAIRSRAARDLYVIMSTVDPQSQRATFRVIVRPLVAWIWVGGLLLLLGSLIAMWPTTKEILRDRQRASSSSGVSIAAALMALSLAAPIGVWLLSPARASAQSDSSSSLHAGSVVMHNADERKLFARLLCQCGDCARLPLSTCGCGWAERKRAEIRQLVDAGKSLENIQTDYRAEFGAAAIAIPSDRGLDRALWAVPVGIALLAGGGVFLLGRRWRGREKPASKPDARDTTAAAKTTSAAKTTDYDARLDEELSRYEDQP